VWHSHCDWQKLCGLQTLEVLENIPVSSHAWKFVVPLFIVVVVIVVVVVVVVNLIWPSTRIYIASRLI
jgi:hypothetical protein